MTGSFNRVHYKNTQGSKKNKNTPCGLHEILDCLLGHSLLGRRHAPNSLMIALLILMIQLFSCSFFSAAGSLFFFPYASSPANIAGDLN